MRIGGVASALRGPVRRAAEADRDALRSAALRARARAGRAHLARAGPGRVVLAPERCAGAGHRARPRRRAVRPALARGRGSEPPQRDVRRGRAPARRREPRARAARRRRAALGAPHDHAQLRWVDLRTAYPEGGVPEPVAKARRARRAAALGGAGADRRRRGCAGGARRGRDGVEAIRRSRRSQRIEEEHMGTFALPPDRRARRLLLFAAPAACAANPNFDNPTGDPRADAPDDPSFDRAESDDAERRLRARQQRVRGELRAVRLRARDDREHRGVSRSQRSELSRRSRSPACARTRRGSRDAAAATS